MFSWQLAEIIVYIYTNVYTVFISVLVYYSILIYSFLRLNYNNTIACG